MGEYTHLSKVVGVEGLYVGASGSEVEVAAADGTLYQKGTALTPTAAKMNNVFAQNDVTAISADGAVPTSGISLVTGGTGIAGLTLAAPTPGCRCQIKLLAITSGSVVVTCATGVTFDGTNDIATFNAANDELVLAYKSATQWQVVYNNSVDLSATPEG